MCLSRAGWAQPPVGSGRVGAPADAAPAQEPAGTAAAPDAVHLTNGNIVRGYVAEATETAVVLIKEMRRGSFTRATLSRRTVERIEYAPPAARTALKARIDWWEQKKQRDALAASRFITQPSTEHPGAWEATGPYFRIVCDVNASTTREMAFRLNTMYETWGQVFRRGPRGGAPTTMYVVANLAAYRQLMQRAGGGAAAVAMSGGFYAPPPADVSVIPIRFHDADATMAQIAATERRYAGRLDPSAWDRFKRKTKSALATERAAQISTAYHEGMHAFMHKELFPNTHAVPVWLNEGMATYVETQREDMEGLRTQAVNPGKYPVVRHELSVGGLPGIRALVARAASITQHDTGRSAGAFYAASWSLVYFLNNERGALGNDMYARYVDALEGGTPPIAAFELMTGEPLADTEAAWHRAIPNWK